jgi:hypothetical protein
LGSISNLLQFGHRFVLALGPKFPVVNSFTSATGFDVEGNFRVGLLGVLIAQLQVNIIRQLGLAPLAIQTIN